MHYAAHNGKTCQMWAVLNTAGTVTVALAKTLRRKSNY